MLRATIEDQAIEIGIALEAVLIAGDTKDSVIKVAQRRAAVILGGTKEERRRVYSCYDAFYKIRSQAVHQGAVDIRVTYKVKGVGERSVLQLLGDARELCAELMKKIIRAGQFPTWELIFRDPDEVAAEVEWPEPTTRPTTS